MRHLLIRHPPSVYLPSAICHLPSRIASTGPRPGVAPADATSRRSRLSMLPEDVRQSPHAAPHCGGSGVPVRPADSRVMTGNLGAGWEGSWLNLAPIPKHTTKVPMELGKNLAK